MEVLFPICDNFSIVPLSLEHGINTAIASIYPPHNYISVTMIISINYFSIQIDKKTLEGTSILITIRRIDNSKTPSILFR